MCRCQSKQAVLTLAFCFLQALLQAKSSDLLLWASRYNLFVLWSADRTHPWDSMENANKVAAVLDIGKLSGSKDEVIPSHSSLSFLIVLRRMRALCITSSAGATDSQRETYLHVETMRCLPIPMLPSAGRLHWKSHCAVKALPLAWWLI